MSRALEAIAADDPITLAEASDVVLRGAVSEQTLRAEARRGNLEVERLGKNLFTTPNYMKATARALKNGSLRTLRKSTPRGPARADVVTPFPSRK